MAMGYQDMHGKRILELFDKVANIDVQLISLRESIEEIKKSDKLQVAVHVSDTVPVSMYQEMGCRFHNLYNEYVTALDELKYIQEVAQIIDDSREELLSQDYIYCEDAKQWLK